MPATMTTLGNHTASSWKEASAKVKEIADSCGIKQVSWGCGNPIYTPVFIASTLDAWSGEGVGYFMRWYPKGEGYMAPCVMGYVNIQFSHEKNNA